MSEITLNIGGSVYRVQNEYSFIYTAVDKWDAKKKYIKREGLYISAKEDTKFQDAAVIRPAGIKYEKKTLEEGPEQDFKKINEFERAQLEHLQLMIENAENPNQKRKLVETKELSEWLAAGKTHEDKDRVEINGRDGKLLIKLIPFEKERGYEKGSLKILISEPAAECPINKKDSYKDLFMIQITDGKDAIFYEKRKNSRSLADEYLRTENFLSQVDEFSIRFRRTMNKALGLPPDYIHDASWIASSDAITSGYSGPKFFFPSGPIQLDDEVAQITENSVLAFRAELNAIEKFAILLLKKMIDSSEFSYQKKYLAEQLIILEKLSADKEIERKK